MYGDIRRVLLELETRLNEVESKFDQANSIEQMNELLLQLLALRAVLTEKHSCLYLLREEGAFDSDNHHEALQGVLQELKTVNLKIKSIDSRMSALELIKETIVAVLEFSDFQDFVGLIRCYGFNECHQVIGQLMAEHINKIMLNVSFESFCAFIAEIPQLAVVMFIEKLALISPSLGIHTIIQTSEQYRALLDEIACSTDVKAKIIAGIDSDCRFRMEIVWNKMFNNEELAPDEMHFAVQYKPYFLDKFISTVKGFMTDASTRHQGFDVIDRALRVDSVFNVVFAQHRKETVLSLLFKKTHSIKVIEGLREKYMAPRGATIEA